MIRFAQRMDLLQGSEISELLKLTARPEIISFAGGLPSPELFPVEEMKAASERVLAEDGTRALQYSTTEGFDVFRQQIADMMERQSCIKAHRDSILVTNGSQQGLDFSGRVFLDKGDVVLMESPSYLGAINSFKTCEGRFIEIDTDDTGMKIDSLRSVLEREERVKMIYVIPDFQNPSGRTWSLERRKEFMDLINEFQIPVVEDNAYGPLRFEGETLPALKSLDTRGLVIYLGSFSKVLAPGYRLGWVCADGKILDMYGAMAQSSTLQASTIAQLEVSRFMEMYSLDDHVDKIKAVYAKRRNVMLKAMEQEFPGEAIFTRPQGGLFTWVVLPEHIDTTEMAKKCFEKNVAYVPGASFFPNGGNRNCFRLNYSCMDEDRIVEGIKRLASVIKEELLCMK